MLKTGYQNLSLFKSQYKINSIIIRHIFSPIDIFSLFPMHVILKCFKFKCIVIDKIFKRHFNTFRKERNKLRVFAMYINYWKTGYSFSIKPLIGLISLLIIKIKLL